MSPSPVPPRFLALTAAKARLANAIAKDRSPRWCLQLWGRYIKLRDGHRCVCCNGIGRLQAHHVVRKTLYPWGAFELGNGICLCNECHGRVHAEFNGAADLSQPLGAQGGDDQDEWAFLFGLLFDDAKARFIDQDEFYYLGDHMLKFFFKCQGYEPLYQSALNGDTTRIRFAHEVWRVMPELWYKNCVAEIIRLNYQPR